jgi:hypothetical protein
VRLPLMALVIVLSAVVITTFVVLNVELWGDDA